MMEKATLFRDLHHRDHAFIIPNPWDAGSARILAHLGFSALATTSFGYALSAGKLDGEVAREEMLAHVAAIAAATNLPVSADLENGYGDAPEACAETIRLAAQAGAVGGSIEDATGNPAGPIYCREHAAARISAAAEAARNLPFPFTLTARAENFINGYPDLKDTIERLQLYQQAGADVLYAPGITDRAQIAELVRSVDRPVNVLVGLRGVKLSLDDLSALGVKRASVGSALCRRAFQAFLEAAQEMAGQGTFHFAETALPSAQVREILDFQ